MKDYEIDTIIQFNSCVHESFYDIMLMFTDEEMKEYSKINNVDVSGFDDNFIKKDIDILSII
jgi:hypothetical protein